MIIIKSKSIILHDISIPYLRINKPQRLDIESVLLVEIHQVAIGTVGMQVEETFLHGWVVKEIFVSRLLLKRDNGA